MGFQRKDPDLKLWESSYNLRLVKSSAVSGVEPGVRAPFVVFYLGKFNPNNVHVGYKIVDIVDWGNRLSALYLCFDAAVNALENSKGAVLRQSLRVIEALCNRSDLLIGS